jgi:DNA-binding Lrp family transcriptional regulator
VARRYDRLRTSGMLRVRGLLEPSKAGRTQWIVRIRCTPGISADLADTLASSVDITWISLISGGAEIVCVLSTPSDADPAPLLASLPLTRGVLAIDAHCVLHEYFGGTVSLINKNGPLTDDQIEALGPRPDVRPTGCRPLDPGDDRLLRALQHDGRASVASIASIAGWSQSSVRRRITALTEAHLLYFDVDFDQALLGLQMRAIMWLRVPADQLAAAGKALAGYPEVGYVAATTGSTNLYSAISCESPKALYLYVTERVARLGSVRQLETAPITHSVKTSGVLAQP